MEDQADVDQAHVGRPAGHDLSTTRTIPRSRSTPTSTGRSPTASLPDNVPTSAAERDAVPPDATRSTCRTRGRVLPNLTVNVGLRYDNQQIFTRRRHPADQPDRQLGAAHRLHVGSDAGQQDEGLRLVRLLLRADPDGPGHPLLQLGAAARRSTTSIRPRSCPTSTRPRSAAGRHAARSPNGGGKILGRLQRPDRPGPEGPVPAGGHLRRRARDRSELRGRRAVRLPRPAARRRGLPLRRRGRLLRRQPDRGPDGEPLLARLQLAVSRAEGHSASTAAFQFDVDQAVLGQLDDDRLVRLRDAQGQLRRPLRAVHAAARHGGPEHLRPLRLLRLLHRRARRSTASRSPSRRTATSPTTGAASPSCRASTSRPSTSRSAS